MRYFVRHDLDGFFGLFIDNLVQLLLIVALCQGLCGMTGDQAYLLTERVLPGAAVSILVGNLFYARQAHRLARRNRRDDVTALPYGVNTPSLLVYVFFVMAPTFRETGSAETAWRMGLAACLGSGVLELLGSLVSERIRRHTPRAALLSTLAGIAIGFIAMTFALEIWSAPWIAMAPMGVVLITYFSGVRFPLGLPGGFVAILLGTLLAWLLPGSWTGRSLQWHQVRDAWEAATLSFPQWHGGELWNSLNQPSSVWLRLFSVIVPMGLFNVLGSLQNIESAAAAGDHYDTRSSLAVNGIGTVLAALFGSCFPTTIYIGHAGWKGLGAGAGYSTLNGLAVTALCLTGTMSLVSHLIPIEAGMAIVLWIGIVITAQAFQASPPRHAPAVAIGLFPAIAAFGATVALGAIAAFGGTTIEAILRSDAQARSSGFLLHGLIVLERGYIFTCMVLAAVTAALIDRRFWTAAAWATAGAAVTLTGLCHAYQVSGQSVDYLLMFIAPAEGRLAYRAYDITVGYGLMAALFAGIGVFARRRQSPDALPRHADA